MKKIWFIIVVLGLFSCAGEKVEQLNSPDGNIVLLVSDKDGLLETSLLYKGDTIIGNSPLGLQIQNFDFSTGVHIQNIEESVFDETWNAVNGKNKTVRNHYNQKIFHIQSATENDFSCDLVLRCYNDGFAYRFIVKNVLGDSMQWNGENTKLHFKDDFTFWAYNGEQHNVGPEKCSFSSLKEVRIPMVLELQDNLFMAIHEAEIVRYAPLNINLNGESKSLGFTIEETSDKGELKTSWRTFMIGNRPGDLVESDLLVNLNEPCKIEDTSWIKPGKSLWDWRVWGYKSQDGFEYGLNTVSHKRFIDFASENNIQYLLIDADWYGPEFSDTSDPTAAREGINIEECMAYAKQKGVGVILYLNDVGAKKFGLERVLKQFSDWGATGVKYGFMQGSWEEKVRHTREVVELCAKYKLMVDFHDNPVPPSGDRRTHPNLITKEFCHAQADAKRSYFPETAVTSPFVNMIAGPLDYTNGWFDLNHAQSRERVFEEIPGTVAAEVAKLVVTYTGWTVLPDSPEEYLKKNDLFDCIRKMPPQFDSFQVLDGKIGEYISVARKAGENWFIGSLTNRDARNIEIDLDFLPEGKSYKTIIYEDTENTHYLDNKESYQIEEKVVQSGDKLKIYMAPGGGNTVYLEELK
jgi:alpha-glucosidase